MRIMARWWTWKCCRKRRALLVLTLSPLQEHREQHFRQGVHPAAAVQSMQSNTQLQREQKQGGEMANLEMVLKNTLLVLTQSTHSHHYQEQTHQCTFVNGKMASESNKARDG
jgi:hypothetical protein